jgi:hypothetical protein
LNDACGSQLCSQPLKVLYVVGNDNSSFNLVKMLEINGYTVSVESNRSISNDDNRSAVYVFLLTIRFSSNVVSASLFISFCFSHL